jgi:hypothetical protein
MDTKVFSKVEQGRQLPSLLPPQSVRAVFPHMAFLQTSSSAFTVFIAAWPSDMVPPDSPTCSTLQMIHQLCSLGFLETLFAVMPLRSSRFYLFGDPHYYGHIRLPRLHGFCSILVRVSHVHALPLLSTQQHLTPGIWQWVLCRFPTLPWQVSASPGA